MMTAFGGRADTPDDGTEKQRATLTAATRTRRQADRIRVAIQETSTTWYKKYILEGILRQKPLKPSKDGRHIPLQVEHDGSLVDERRGRAFIPNTIRTSRYTVYDFIPKQLIFQFTRLANFYFLCVGIPQTIPGLSTTGSFTTILPLLFFVLLIIAKEGYDDYKRHRLDTLENANISRVLGRPRPQAVPPSASRRWPWSRRVTAVASPPPQLPDEADNDADDEHQWNKTHWRDVKVGDIVRLSRDEDVPADMVLIHASGENGIAYIDTMALDGETTLKTKETSQVFEGCGSIRAIKSFSAEFVVEDPNPDLYRFNGKVIVDDRIVPLTLNEVVYRGSTLRNTNCAFGMVINTGEECKIRMNANQHPQAKKPALETISNKIVITLAVYVIILTVGCSMGYIIWRTSTEQWNVFLNVISVDLKEIVIGYAIMFNNVIPLALYVSLELVKIGQLIMINSDLEMYDEATDTPARCNTNTILENLGQVSYIFSDKTGTLTENVMKFRKMSIAGTSWLHEMDLQAEDPSPVNPIQSNIPATPRKSFGAKSREAALAIPKEDNDTHIASPISVTSPQLTRRSTHHRRSSSHWRSSGRPDHPQPDVTTADLLEYIRLRPATPFARKARDFILSLALCHTCLPEVKDGEIDFQASSPDEVALVRAAQELGYLVIHRSSQTVTLKITSSDGTEKTEVYQILDVIEFSSKRKRMSIIVRYPDGQVCLICKGADSMILPRLKLANLALKKANEFRKSAELEHELLRRSEQMDPQNSFGGRPSLSIVRKSIGGPGQASSSKKQPEIERSRSVEAFRKRQSEDRGRPSLGVRRVSFDISKALSPHSPMLSPGADDKFSFLDDPSINDDSTVFTRCFKHLDDFATEGLRTLLFARKFIPELEYRAWKKVYSDATTSLVDRQEAIEAAGEIIEQSLDLVGASAIEDKLQAGVPETIDKLRRANIKIWMLTGDKRETAINIAHSARICRPSSDIFILDASRGGGLEAQMMGVAEDMREGCIHSVVVIDGHTLGVVEQNPMLRSLFYALIPTVDSVICCRASPAQKAAIVKAIRRRLPKALTLAIGDGANDLAMISASHVGVGISGKEGLQAARVADYAIAQFRFLQRLLLVHGRWNYARSAKFILATFWKEMFFYLPTALYQRHVGYTGTSLYEMASLTVFNTLFTSLCVIVPGIWEQDLDAITLLAVPELYVFGQRDLGLNFWKFMSWMLGAAIEGVGVWFGVWLGYGGVLGMINDPGLFAMGDLAFTIGVIWINYKLFILETHNKTVIVLGSFAITFAGWWAWNAFLDGIYTPSPSPYDIRDGFTETFGSDPIWWLTLIGVLMILITAEMVYKTLKRYLALSGLWGSRWLPSWRTNPAASRGGSGQQSIEEWDLALWQELEQDPVVRERLRKIYEAEENGEESEGDEEGPRGDDGTVMSGAGAGGVDRSV